MVDPLAHFTQFSGNINGEPSANKQRELSFGGDNVINRGNVHQPRELTLEECKAAFEELKPKLESYNVLIGDIFSSDLSEIRKTVVGL